ncbi:DUF1853 family protein [Halieaceae bacterium IMCC14734]|uniref:DUF1853 family protein n=1 Tax=Candidatus Litorirhabdus singularis TaxID=2518993 RepID=A0ABT3THE9_9GAMM|nr:DUF1853 family protein [Candidatus Litorirhabdus singularis]MCX2981699.1 DUF1853 family protein [Candidatus Litorirhabdus singularis]
MLHLWDKLHHQQVRDLAWACFSPPLLNSKQLGDPEVGNCALELTPAREQLLLQLDASPGALEQHLAARVSTRLGLYFEALWHFFLAADESVELVAHNLPVRDGGRTLGEFDVIYWCLQRQQHVHLELALKYYLGLPGQDIWLGPNQRDRLSNKVQHLVQRQIRLSEQTASTAPLLELGVKKLRREIEVKGYLFDAPHERALPPAGLHAGNPLRRWLEVDEFASHNNDTARWLILTRQQWLAPVSVNPQCLLTTERATTLANEQFSQGRGPLMVAECDSQGLEYNRCFVTPPSWPIGDDLPPQVAPC